MTIIKSLFCLRDADREAALINIRSERLIFSLLLKYGLVLYLGFSIVDGFAVGSVEKGIWYFFFRGGIALIAFCALFVLRGRVPREVRFGLMAAIFLLGVQSIMILEGLEYTTYYAGLPLVLFFVCTFWPMRHTTCMFIYSIALLPTITAYLTQIFDNVIESSLGLGMTFGMIAVGAVVSTRNMTLLSGEVKANRQLTDDLSKRESEVKEKAKELVKRRQFESQFSPQVVSEVLNDFSGLEMPTYTNISILVVDIVGSTRKASELKAEIYAEVVQDIFDIVNAGCLKWDITIDKFTGDGAQAFAGSPKKGPDDFSRTVRASWDILRMLYARSDHFETKWQEGLKLRLAVCEGEAFVGFLGKGMMKTYSAIGRSVSLSHRLCEQAKGNSVVVHSENRDMLLDDIPTDLFSSVNRQYRFLKGFEGSEVNAYELKPKRVHDNMSYDFGRCEVCATPLVMDQDSQGIPKIVCPACLIKQKSSLTLNEGRGA